MLRHLRSLREQGYQYFGDGSGGNGARLTHSEGSPPLKPMLNVLNGYIHAINKDAI